MRNKLNQDGNIVGRLGALALLIAAGFGLHRINCSTGEMCPLMKTDSCCAGADHAPKAAPAAAKTASPSPAK